MIAPIPARRRWLWPKSLAGKAVAVLAYAVMLLGLTWVGAFVAGKHRLANALAEARRLGWNESWEVLSGPIIPEEDNAAIPMAEVARLTGKLFDDARAKNRKAGSAPERASPIAVEKKLASDPEYERLLNDADRRPRYRTLISQADIDSANPTRLADVGCQSMPLVAEAECKIATELCASGKRQEAANRMLRLLRITRKWTASEPFFTSHNLAVMIRMNAFSCLNRTVRGGLPKPLHDDIDRELALHERVTRDSALAANGVRELHLARSRMAPVHRIWAFKPLALIAEASAHEEFNDYVQSIDETFQVYSFRPKPQFPLAGLPRNWIGESAEGLKHARQKFDESTALARCLRIVNAMAARNDFDLNLDSLGLPEESLVDPMDGQRLRSAKTSAGTIVYSVGSNCMDDGGRLERGKGGYDIGFGPTPQATKP